MRLEGKSELFRALRPSRMGHAQDGHDFVCDECGKPFVIPFDHYEGQFDHEPSVPICNDCAERLTD